MAPDSEVSEQSDFDPKSESFYERITALRMIVPASTRYWLGLRARTGAHFVRTFFRYGGRITWGIFATVMLFGIPFAICVTEEQQMLAIEQEQKQREAGGEMLLAGGGADQDGGAITAQQLAGALDGGKADAKPAL